MPWLRRLVDLVGSDLPAILITIVLLVVSADVFVRTVLRESFHTAHDIAIIAFAGVVWFGIVGAALNRQLFGVRFFVDRLPARGRLIVQAATHLVVVLVSLAVLRAAMAQVSTSHFTTFLAIGWPKWIVPAGLGLAMGIVAVINLVQLLELWRGRNLR